MPTVALTIDCEAAHENRHCYAVDLVKVAEEFSVPLTWMIYVSNKDPISNMQLYRQEYLHRIPAWHEIGLHLHFENDNGYVEDPHERAHMILTGKDILKSNHVKPTAFRAGCFALIPPDLKALEEAGFVVDASVVPDANYKMFIDWKGAPSRPYHPDYSDIRKEGDAKLLEVPVATFNGEIGYLNGDFQKIKPLLDNAAKGETLVLGTHDYYDSTDVLRQTLSLLKSKGARFTTLTGLASERL